MLSSTSRQTVMEKINSKLGFQIKEEELSPNVRQSITNISMVQRHLYVIMEILRGEESRVSGNPLLSFASRLGKDSGRKERLDLSEQISKLQAEIDNKISEIADRILAEYNARAAGEPIPGSQRKIEAVKLKCPTCGANLPIPTGRFVRCEFCKSTISIQDVSTQISGLIQSI
jgi:DNA-directed RNA polymerase subunit RPC12/RpoP